MKVSRKLFGYNLECTRRVGYSGIYAEMLENNKFKTGTIGFYPVEWDGMTGWGQCTEHIHLRSGHTYNLAALGGTRTRIRIRTEYDAVLFESDGPRAQFYSQFSIAHARFEAVSDGELRYVSMQLADSFHGCRRDVLDAFKAFHPGSIRVPGGCYASRYSWKDGLKPVEDREGIHTQKKNLFSASNDYDSCELNVDDYAAVARYTGAELEYTVRLMNNEPQDAADLVEYCWGGADTQWGALRIARGYGQPYAINTWYIGNELAFQKNSPLKNAQAACEVSDRFVKAMRAVKPDIKTVVSTGIVPEWDKEFIQIAKEINYCSQHDYLIDTYPVQTLETLLKAPLCATLPKLERARATLGEKPMLFDEWNSLWGSTGSGAGAMYAAGVSTMLIRNAQRLNLLGASYFCPINEGCIRVYPDHVLLAPDGEVLSRMALHADGEWVDTGDEAVVVTQHDGYQYASVLNTSVDQAKEVSFAGEYEILIPDADRVIIEKREGELKELPPAAVAFVYTSNNV